MQFWLRLFLSLQPSSVERAPWQECRQSVWIRSRECESKSFSFLPWEACPVVSVVVRKTVAVDATLVRRDRPIERLSHPP
ncbi:hypothetical protein Poly24_37510 [Rosistilla carotiformis]|uniref:Uncharacterized protein n=1 Tax=Rosistilla carotiformis TaxID=2528017 RepID=A0A518JWW4_9BACT|nr:hypothetical protein Poly24_37510 [Rosistilla carotiformis]